jgi:replicative DNA helicase
MIDDRLRKNRHYQDFGGEIALSNIVDMFPSAGIQTSLGIIKKLYSRRKMFLLGQKLQASANNNELETLSELGKEMALITQTSMATTESQTETVSEVAQRVYEDTVKRSEDSRNGIIPYTGIKTGIEALDNSIVGMKGGQVITLGGRPSSGKTALSGIIMDNIANIQQEEILFFNFEMQNDEVLERILSKNSKCNYGALQRGDYTSVYDNSLSEAFITQTESKLFLNQNPMTPDQMRLEIRKLKTTKAPNLKGIFIDYLEKIKVPKNLQSKSMYEKVSFLSNEIKAIAKEFNIFVFCLAQLNRKVDDRLNKRPMLSDFNNSGVIEADSHCALMISQIFKYHSEIKELENIVLLDVVKNRSGALKEVYLYFEGAIMNMRKIRKDEYINYRKGLDKIRNGNKSFSKKK